MRKLKIESPWSADAEPGKTGATYEIRTVVDFLKVPEARRRICLREFHSWMAMQEGVAALLEATADTLGGDLKAGRDFNFTNDVFAWIDDGAATITVNMLQRELAAPDAEPE